MVHARGLGKFYSSRKIGRKACGVGEYIWKVLAAELKLNFFGPAGGSRTRKGAFALKSEFTWLVETEIAFSVEQQYLSRTMSEPNCGESDRRIFEVFLTKMVISRDPVDRFR